MNGTYRVLLLDVLLYFWLQGSTFPLGIYNVGVFVLLFFLEIQNDRLHGLYYTIHPCWVLCYAISNASCRRM